MVELLSEKHAEGQAAGACEGTAVAVRSDAQQGRVEEEEAGEAAEGARGFTASSAAAAERAEVCARGAARGERGRELAPTDLYRAVRRATLTAARRDDFRVVHISIQRTHIHLLVEAKDEKALARGMQGFQISAAKHINAVLPKVDGRRRRGTVFPDRYHAEVIEHPYQARRALAYVLNNWRKHGEHRDPAVRGWRVDLFSSGVTFDGWIDGPPSPSWPPEYEPLAVSPARTWMLSVGWRQFGLIDKREVPSAQAKRTRIERAVRAQVRMLADLASES